MRTLRAMSAIKQALDDAIEYLAQPSPAIDLLDGEGEKDEALPSPSNSQRLRRAGDLRVNLMGVRIGDDGMKVENPKPKTGTLLRKKIPCFFQL